MAKTPAPALEQRNAIELSNLKIGKISDFPVGIEMPVGSNSLLVESLAEGLRIRSISEAHIYYAIFANAYGELSVNCTVTWPADMVYSILTGEPTRLCTILEERT